MPAKNVSHRCEDQLILDAKRSVEKHKEDFSKTLQEGLETNHMQVHEFFEYYKIQLYLVEKKQKISYIKGLSKAMIVTNLGSFNFVFFQFLVEKVFEIDKSSAGKV